MKLYTVIIEPTSGFGTPLKGDSLFGHFCWQAANDPGLLEGGLEKQIAAYPERPFAVFSSAFPVLEDEDRWRYVLKRPELPFQYMLPPAADLADTIRRRKAFKKKKWMVADADLRLDMKTGRFKSDAELIEMSLGRMPEDIRRRMAKLESHEFIRFFSQPHNTINRLTQTTGAGMFAPYAKENHYFFPGTCLVLFVLIDNGATDIDRVRNGLVRIGKWGFGRDASTGMGRFSVRDTEELSLAVPRASNACYTLAPSVPQKEVFETSFFKPFIRYGKHGDRLAGHDNPFKNPVIMADEASVFIPKDDALLKKPYVGQAVSGVSKALPETVVQGYAPYLPFKLEI